MKVRKAALDVMGVMHSQLGSALQSLVKSKDIQSSTMSLLDKAFSDHPHDANAQSVERKMKCITLGLASKNSSHQGSSQSTSSILSISIPTTDLMASLKSDCLSRLTTTEGKTAWKLRKEAMEEVNSSLSKCCGLISTEGKAILSLKELFIALRSRLNDSQSNLKPIASTLIGSLLNCVDDEAQAKLGKIVFPALVNAAMNDMKKTMRDAAVSALSMGTERSQQNGGGTNLLTTECFILCLETELTDAALKSSGLPDVLAFLHQRLESLFSSEQTEHPKTISANRQLAKVIVLSLLSSKAGTRSSAEKLLSVGVVSSEALDREIGKLLPAQQRTVRSVIPKLSAQEQELVETFRRPESRARQTTRVPSSRQPARREVASRSNKVASTASPTHKASASKTNDEIDMAPNPLQPRTSKSTKLQRLSVLGRSDNWPEWYSEEPNDATIQSLCKSWSLLISPSSVQLLFPSGGFRSHEDALRGCEIISRSIEYSRSNNDALFLEQLDLIFKWVACALFSRDHTAGLRSLLCTVQLLFERLRELSYQMNDAEAIILLPHILEKAAVAKPQFKGQCDDLLSFVRLKELYPLKQYGSNILMRIVEKSKSNSARSLAAAECSSCVSVIGVGAIGRKGVIILARALSAEKLADIRNSYLDLFYNVVQAYGDLDKLLLIAGDNLTDKARQMIVDRCSKRHSTAPADSQTPSRKSVTRTSGISLRASNGSGKVFSPSSSSAVTLKANKATKGSQPYSPSRRGIRQVMPPTPPPPKVDDLNALGVMRAMIDGGTEVTAEGLTAMHMLMVALKNDTSDGSLTAAQIESLRQQFASDLDQSVETMAR